MDRYFSDGKVNLENLQIVAKPLPKPMSFSNFVEQFGTDKKTVIHSPISDVIIDVKSQYYKMKTWKENRLHLSGVIKEIIEDPLLILNHKGAIKYYAPYVDKNNLVHILSITENKNNVDILKSNYEPFNLKTLEKLLLDIKEKDLLYVKYVKKDVGVETLIPASPTMPHCSYKTNDISSTPIIPKNNNLVKVEYTAGNLYTDLEAMEAFKKEINDFWLRDYIKFDDRKTPERNIIYSQYLDTLRPHSNEYAGDLANASGKTNEDPNINQIIPKNNKKSS